MQYMNKMDKAPNEHLLSPRDKKNKNNFQYIFKSSTNSFTFILYFSRMYVSLLI